MTVRRMTVAVLALGGVFALLAVRSPAPASASTRPASGAAGANATILFDVSSGQVLAESNARTNLRVASTFKVLTALVIRSNVSMDAMVPVTKRATDVPPLKLSITNGSRWEANGLLHAMLIASLNDAAVALAQAAGGGTLAGFDRALAAQSRRLGLADKPVLHDPAGLDDDSSVSGGNLISARDLAIATRAFLSDPFLAAIVAMPSYRFSGGDGKPHVVYNHNAFLQTYEGAIGVKTGYTERSGHSLIAAARRGDRTLGVVVVGSSDPVGVASAQLDRGFALAPDARPTDDMLPATDGVAPPPPTGGTAPVRASQFTAIVPPRSGRSPFVPVVAIVAVGAVGAGSVVRRGRRREQPEWRR